VFANVLMIGFVVVGFVKMGIGALVLGTLAGAFAQLLVQLPAFFSLHVSASSSDWRHPGSAAFTHRARADRDRVGGGT